MTDERHVSAQEAAAAQNPTVGEGTPETAPERSPDEFSSGASWVPTRKWFAAAATGLLTIAGHAVASGGWDATEWGELTALGVALAGAYFLPNEPTPGGVPRA